MLLIAAITACGTTTSGTQRKSQQGGADAQQGKIPGTPPMPNTSPSGLPNVPQNNDDQSTPPSTPLMSGGSGGALGESEQRFTASNNKSSSYKISVPSDVGTNAYGLLVYLHGDGGGDYKWFFRDNARIGLQHKLIGITILAPNFGKQWYNGGDQNSVYVHELIQNEIFKKYNVDTSRVYFAGTSGGSQFLTGQFLPIYGLHYDSGAVMMCGGPANWQRKLNADDDFLKKFKFAWIATKYDFLLPQVEKGIAYYRDKGFQVEENILPQGNHCSFPGGLDDALAKMLAKIVR